MKRIASAVTAIVMLCECSATTRPSTALPPPGCYALTLGAWSAAHEADEPPATLRLLDSTGTDLLERGKQLVRPLEPDSTFRYWAWWEPHGADSLEVVFTTGYVGVQLRLAARDAAWRGHAEAFTDVVPTLQATAQATLTDIACP
ncbi:MAG TPA: hypothetical protein VF041_20520 [Gemmatimonadaceae bacterium]